VLCIAPGLYIHSNKGRGVEFDQAEDFPLATSPVSGRRFLSSAVRLNNEEATASRNAQIIERAFYFYKQKYNAYFFVKNSLASERFRKSAAFCSEFISAVYRDIGIPLTNLDNEMVFPSTLEACLTLPRWLDVTDEYRRGLAEAAAAQSQQPFVEPLRSALLRGLQFNSSLIAMNALTNQIGDLASASQASQDVEAARALISSLEGLVDLPESWLDQHMEMLNHVMDYERPKLLHFSQDVNPRLAPKQHGEVVRQIDGILRQEMQMQESALEGITGYVETVLGFYEQIASLKFRELEETDVESFSRYAANVGMLASEQMELLHKATIELLHLANVDCDEQLEPSQVLSLIDHLKPKAQGRPELLGLLSLFLRNAELRISLQSKAIVIAAFEENIPTLRKSAQRLRDAGLLPVLPAEQPSGSLSS
jgi:hypothetical protein